MRKNIGTALFLALALITAFSSCSIEGDEYPTDPRYILGLGGGSSGRDDLIAISISSQPSKQVYYSGDNADWSGLQVMEYYSDGTSGTGYYYDYEISGFNSYTPGIQTITVSKYGAIGGYVYTTFFVTVIDQWTGGSATLVSLSISSYPRLTYNMGESADWTGLAVTEYYSDGSISTGYNYYDYNINGFYSYGSGEQIITVSKYDPNGGYAETSFTITVNSAAVLSSLSIASMPSKTVYTVGESSDWSGLMVTENYSDGSTSTGYNYDYTITGFDSSSSGEKIITVSKYGAIGGYVYTTFTVTVNSTALPNLTELSIVSNPKTAYMVGESYDWSGLAVTEYYSDGSSITGYNYYDYTITGFDSSSFGEKIITVSKYGTNGGYAETYFTVTVGSGAPNSTISNITHTTLDYPWTLDGGWYGSPLIGDDGITRTRVSFISTVANASITIRLNVSSEQGWDYAFISTLDTPNATRSGGGYNTNSLISGEAGASVTISVPTPGSHFIDICYQKDGSQSSGSDRAFFLIE